MFVLSYLTQWDTENNDWYKSRPGAEEDRKPVMMENKLWHLKIACITIPVGLTFFRVFG